VIRRSAAEGFEIGARGARRVIADSTPGYPCRVSLADAAVGDELLLLECMLDRRDVAYVHYAKPSCFACLAVRSR